MNQIEIVSFHKGSKIFENKIRKISRKLLFFLKKENIHLAVYLVDDRVMLDLNKKFRHKNKISNVLSFKEPKNFVYPPIRHRKVKHLGEIYLNTPFLKKQQEILLDTQIKGLLIHSFLHLLGYTHEKNDDRIRMEKFENKISKSI